MEVHALCSSQEAEAADSTGNWSATGAPHLTEAEVPSRDEIEGRAQQRCCLSLKLNVHAQHGHSKCQALWGSCALLQLLYPGDKDNQAKQPGCIA